MRHSRPHQLATLCTVVGVGVPLGGLCNASNAADLSATPSSPSTQRCLDPAEAKALAIDGYVFICREPAVSGPYVNAAAAVAPTAAEAPGEPVASTAAIRYDTAGMERLIADLSTPEPSVGDASSEQSARTHEAGSALKWDIQVVELGDVGTVAGLGDAGTVVELGDVGTVAGLGDAGTVAELPTDAATVVGHMVSAPAIGVPADATDDLTVPAAVAPIMDEAPAGPAMALRLSPALASGVAHESYAAASSEWEVSTDPGRVADLGPAVDLASIAPTTSLDGGGKATPGEQTDPPLTLSRTTEVAMAAAASASTTDVRESEVPTSAAIAAASSEPLAANDYGNASVLGDWVVVKDSALEDLRGGFDLGGGLVVSFGITRTVAVDGTTVSSTSFNVPDVARLTSDQASQLSSHLGSVNLVQNGAGNTFQGSPQLLGGGATVVQNTLDNQTIKNITTINASLNSMSILKSLNTQSTLRDAVLSAMPAR